MIRKVGMDLLGPFPVSTKGNRMIIVAVDYLTIWVELKARPTGRSRILRQSNNLKTYGTPEQVITDRSKCFVSEQTQSLVKKQGNINECSYLVASLFHLYCKLEWLVLHILFNVLRLLITNKTVSWDQVYLIMCIVNHLYLTIILDSFSSTLISRQPAR